MTCPRPARKVAAGSSKKKGWVRQASRQGESEPRSESEQLMEAVVARENLLSAYQRVVSNKGVAGVDRMTVEQLKAHLQKHWVRIKEELLSGRYQPQPVMEGEDSQTGRARMRQLGIPTVVDRLIQQAIHQALSPLFDPGFSESSYGFRAGRSAHQAVKQARQYVSEGRRWVVDLDLEKFFDRVNHDVLMVTSGAQSKGQTSIGLDSAVSASGLMAEGVVSPRVEGTPQGGPLSPLLSNILLDDLDKELERRGHKFCRYADDCNIYVQSRAAGERVIKSVTSFLKPATAPAGKRRQERGSETVAEEIPWLLDDVGETTTIEGGGRDQCNASRSKYAELCPCGSRTEPETVHRRTQTGTARLGELLPAGRGEGRL